MEKYFSKLHSKRTLRQPSVRSDTEFDGEQSASDNEHLSAKNEERKVSERTRNYDQVRKMTDEPFMEQSAKQRKYDGGSTVADEDVHQDDKDAITSFNEQFGVVGKLSAEVGQSIWIQFKGPEWNTFWKCCKQIKTNAQGRVDKVRLCTICWIFMKVHQVTNHTSKESHKKAILLQQKWRDIGEDAFFRLAQSLNFTKLQTRGTLTVAQTNAINYNEDQLSAKEKMELIKRTETELLAYILIPRVLYSEWFIEFIKIVNDKFRVPVLCTQIQILIGAETEEIPRREQIHNGLDMAMRKALLRSGRSISAVKRIQSKWQNHVIQQAECQRVMTSYVEGQDPTGIAAHILWDLKKEGNKRIGGHLTYSVEDVVSDSDIMDGSPILSGDKQKRIEVDLHIRFISGNVRSLQSVEKQQQLFPFLQTVCPDIAILNETHHNKYILNYFYNFYMSTPAPQGGVAIAVLNDGPFYYQSIEQHGNFLLSMRMFHKDLPQLHFGVVSCYIRPTYRQPEGHYQAQIIEKECQRRMEQCPYIFLAGDFNNCQELIKHIAVEKLGLTFYQQPCGKDNKYADCDGFYTNAPVIYQTSFNIALTDHSIYLYDCAMRTTLGKQEQVEIEEEEEEDELNLSNVDEQ